MKKIKIPKDTEAIEIEIPERKEAEVVDVAGEKLFIYFKEIKSN